MKAYLDSEDSYYRYNEEQNQKKPEDRKGLTKDMVAREMYAIGVCSRLTTLRILNLLLDRQIILNKKEKIKTFASLEINHNFDWEKLALTLLRLSINEVKNSIYGVSKDDKTDRLIDELLNRLDNTRREPILIQAQSFPKRSLAASVPEKRSTTVSILKRSKKPKSKKRLMDHTKKINELTA